jgi:hypothetical protein
MPERETEGRRDEPDRRNDETCLALDALATPTLPMQYETFGQTEATAKKARSNKHTRMRAAETHQKNPLEVKCNLHRETSPMKRRPPKDSLKAKQRARSWHRKTFYPHSTPSNCRLKPNAALNFWICVLQLFFLRSRSATTIPYMIQLETLK